MSMLLKNMLLKILLNVLLKITIVNPTLSRTRRDTESLLSMIIKKGHSG